MDKSFNHKSNRENEIVKVLRPLALGMSNTKVRQYTKSHRNEFQRYVTSLSREVNGMKNDILKSLKKSGVKTDQFSQDFISSVKVVANNQNIPKETINAISKKLDLMTELNQEINLFNSTIKQIK